MPNPVVITSVTPSSGHPGGTNLVLIVGSGFDGDKNDMTVKFGAEVALRPRVRNGITAPVTNDGGTLLDCVVPSSIQVPESVGAVDVTVINNKTSLQAIRSGGYTYQRPDLSVKSHLGLVLRELLTQLQRQVLEETVIGSSADYVRPGEADRVAAKIPAIILENVNQVRNEEESFTEAIDTVDQALFTFDRQRETMRHDLEVDVAVVDRDDVKEGGGLERALALVKWATDFFYRNNDLDVETYEGSGTKVSYRMSLAKDFSQEIDPRDRGMIRFRGVARVEAVGVPVGEAVDVGVTFSAVAGTNPEVTIYYDDTPDVPP